MVMAEFKMLDDDANVFKMVGPILAKQSVFECKDVVTQRIAFIEQKVANLETLENEFQKKIAEKQNGIKTLQQQFQKIFMEAQQAAQKAGAAQQLPAQQ